MMSKVIRFPTTHTSIPVPYEYDHGIKKGTGMSNTGMGCSVPLGTSLVSVFVSVTHSIRSSYHSILSPSHIPTTTIIRWYTLKECVVGICTVEGDR